MPQAAKEWGPQTLPITLGGFQEWGLRCLGAGSFPHLCVPIKECIHWFCGVRVLAFLLPLWSEQFHLGEIVPTLTTIIFYGDLSKVNPFQKYLLWPLTGFHPVIYQTQCHPRLGPVEKKMLKERQKVQNTHCGAQTKQNSHTWPWFSGDTKGHNRPGWDFLNIGSLGAPGSYWELFHVPCLNRKTLDKLNWAQFMWAKIQNINGQYVEPIMVEETPPSNVEGREQVTHRRGMISFSWDFALFGCTWTLCSLWLVIVIRIHSP